MKDVLIKLFAVGVCLSSLHSCLNLEKETPIKGAYDEFKVGLAQGTISCIEGRSVCLTLSNGEVIKYQADTMRPVINIGQKVEVKLKRSGGFTSMLNTKVLSQNTTSFHGYLPASTRQNAVVFGNILSKEGITLEKRCELPLTKEQYEDSQIKGNLVTIQYDIDLCKMHSISMEKSNWLGRLVFSTIQVGFVFLVLRWVLL